VVGQAEAFRRADAQVAQGVDHHFRQ
jgi:hypothetical protein